MRFSTLILRTAHEALERRSDLLGLRLSPVRIEQEEATALFDDAVSILGDRVYLSISAPDVQPRLEERRFLAPDERAAEKATKWRNEAHPSRGEHLLYVSAEVFGRAGGLTDCLQEINERALRTTFCRWCASRDSGLPKGFADVLESAGLLDVVSSHQLCEFSDAVARRREAGHRPWEAIGLSLGTMHLASDTRLRAANAVERIRANRELVARVSTSERQRASRKSKEHAQILDALSRAVSGSIGLSSIDLGTIGTTALTRTAGLTPTSARRKRSTTKKASARKKKHRALDTPGAAPGGTSVLEAHQQAAVKGTAPEIQFITATLSTTTTARAEETRKRAAKLLAKPSIWSEEAKRS